MAFDGLITRAVAFELNETLKGGKIEKIYQPEAEELIFHIHSKSGDSKLYISSASSHARIHLITQNIDNPASPPAFCMLLRKYLQGGRIASITQKDWERVFDFEIETMGEMGFPQTKYLTVEIMGKHSNIILWDKATGKIIDSIKRISFDLSRVRQLLPGNPYTYPPTQGKMPITEVTLSFLESLIATETVASEEDHLSKALLNNVQGISPAIADQLASQSAAGLQQLESNIDYIAKALEGRHPLEPVVYEKEGTPVEFHVFPLFAQEDFYDKKSFKTVSEMLEYYYTNKASSNRTKQKNEDLSRSLKAALQKLYLKKQRLSEDLLAAEKADIYRLYGELLTANIHNVKTGQEKVDLNNYYDNSTLTVPLDIKLSPVQNAQSYFKKYGKAKTALKEKKSQLEEVQSDIIYLESVAAFIEQAGSPEEAEAIRTELVEGGFLRHRKNKFQTKKVKAAPHSYTIGQELSRGQGFKVMAGRNNKDNDMLTFKTASRTDIWLHTKDIPGSHVILFTGGLSPEDLPEGVISEAAAIAAYHSKGQTSENVPVDYVQVRHVKKPAGARPGMVIFTNNKTIWVDPALPNSEKILNSKK